MAKRKERLLGNVIQAEFDKTRYDYKAQQHSYILLLARDSKGGPGSGRSIQITPGFNFSTFLEMGRKGYLTGEAKKDYKEYMKKLEAGLEDTSIVFRDSGIGVQEKISTISTTNRTDEEDNDGYHQDFYQG